MYPQTFLELYYGAGTMLERKTNMNMRVLILVEWGEAVIQGESRGVVGMELEKDSIAE